MPSLAVTLPPVSTILAASIKPQLINSNAQKPIVQQTVAAQSSVAARKTNKKPQIEHGGLWATINAMLGSISSVCFDL